MIIGIDVGGTHTDAVLVDKTGLIRKNKTLTDRGNLSATISRSLKEILADTPPSSIKKINLSTTITTNSIVENSYEKTALAIIPGPGCNPEEYFMDDHSFYLKGSIDHRGTVTEEPIQSEIDTLFDSLSKESIKTMAVVSKFSTRNTSIEESILKQCGTICDFITPGHMTSGTLNFPRRINTAYYNSAVWRTYNAFSDSIMENLKSMGITCEVNILKADGGTIPIAYSRTRPVESILSGPSASIMGGIALDEIHENTILLDIGGTTTDISLYVNKSPLIEKGGATINRKLTSVRSLMSRSIGIGGDSYVRIENGTLLIGPERKGQPLCLGGKFFTVIDAFTCLGLCDFGEKDKSIAGIQELSDSLNISSEETAQLIIRQGCEIIEKNINELLNEINSKPVYTVHEVVEDKHISPDKLCIIGAPAKLFEQELSKKYRTSVPEHCGVANAIGAAMSRTTMECTLFADTSKGIMRIPELNVEKKIDTHYSVKDAEKDIANHLGTHLKNENIGITSDETEITQRSVFKMIDGYYSSGYDIRLTCQVKPGIDSIFNGGKQNG